MAKNQMIYFFGGGSAEGTAAMKNLLGGKGANVAEMTNLGIPVPPGFTITTEVCTSYYDNGGRWPDGLETSVKNSMIRLEKLLTKGFGSADDPLLVSVRSGARVSMPGMMDTVLNLGLNADSVRGLAKKTGNERFAYDSYRRFMQMYGDVVLGISSDLFEEALAEVKAKYGAKGDTDLTSENLQEVVEHYKKIVQKETGQPFPENVWDQIRGAIDAVFRSWNNKRAIEYRKINGIPGSWGTAVTVQAMVYGNLGESSATGVVFTRDPTTGDDRIVGEYLINAQGEDVVAGIRTPQQITEEHRIRESSNLPSMEAAIPDLYGDLKKLLKRLEGHYKYPQDVEFTIQEGRLFLLQTRNAKRTATAGLRWAVDMQSEGTITWEEGLAYVTPEDIERVFHPYVDPKHEADAKAKTIGKGLAGSPGAYAGRVVFDPDTAVAWQGRGEKVILVRKETSPDDIHGMNASLGFLTAVGGMTSHAVLVARQMGKTCVAGCGEENLRVDQQKKIAYCGDKTLKEGDWITLDGNVGRFIAGSIPTVEPKPDERFNTYMSWVDKMRRLQVWTNADTPGQARRARELGAQGIGLCRTEHMFFADDRIPIMKDMILHLNDAKKRKECLEKLLPLQKADFRGILKEMEGLPVTIRLLDPPLHEFLPKESEILTEMATLRATGKNPQRLSELETINKAQDALHEFNPMLGHRGCRLAITFPDIYEMQSRAIFEAACELKREGVDVLPEVMIPLVGHVKELEITRRSVEAIAKQVMDGCGVEVDYHVGTMIEVPRAALTADQIAKQADFFSFGTNDLTQMGFGFSRDDIGKFLPAYLNGLDEKRDGRKQEPVFEKDPFVAIDQTGIGRLMRMAVEDGRGANAKLKIGICGEHGGEPSSVMFCHKIGLTYVSCSPLRVPVARAAAAHAVLRDRKEELERVKAAAAAATVTEKAKVKKAPAAVPAAPKPVVTRKAPARPVARAASIKKAPAAKAPAPKAPVKKAPAGKKMTRVAAPKAKLAPKTVAKPKAKAKAKARVVTPKPAARPAKKVARPAIAKKAPAKAPVAKKAGKGAKALPPKKAASAAKRTKRGGRAK